MSTTLFVALLFGLSLVSSLFTEAFKKVFNITSPTLLVFILSFVVGWGGGVIAYILLGVAFTQVSIICLGLLAPAIWLCATLGYDKVMEVVEQLIKIKK